MSICSFKKLDRIYLGTLSSFFKCYWSMYLWNYCSKIDGIRMKHHKKQFSSSQQKPGVLGNATSMIGKNILTLTFNIEVANQLDFKHNESVDYEIVNNRLIIKKKDANF